MSLYFLTEKSLKNLCYSFTEGTKHWQVPEGERFKVSQKKNESIVGISAAMAIGFRATQVNLLNKIKYIGNFYF